MSADLAVRPVFVPGVRITEIVVGERARKDYGDLTGLMESIRQVGLLQPIGLAPGNHLLFGGRRLEACRRLGWESIPVTRPETQTDALSLLKAERDENTCRKDMTPEELVDLGLRLEELERPRAKERQGARHDLRPTSSSREEEVIRKHEATTDIAVGEALGMSAATYFRAKSVVQAARDDTAKPEVRAAAQESLTQMNSGATTINGAYNKVRKAKAQVSPVEPAKPGQPLGRKSAKRTRPEVLRGTHRIDSRRVIAATVDTAAANTLTRDLLAEIDLSELDTNDLEEWISSLSESIRALTSLKTTLKKELSQRG